MKTPRIYIPFRNRETFLRAGHPDTEPERIICHLRARLFQLNNPLVTRVLRIIFQRTIRAAKVFLDNFAQASRKNGFSTFPLAQASRADRLLLPIVRQARGRQSQPGNPCNS